MYLVRDSDGFDSTSLRQGDILTGIPFPRLKHGEIQVLGAIDRDYDYAAIPSISPQTHENNNESGWVTIQVPARFCFCAVLSNCCDLEPRNGKVRPATLTLARLKTISGDVRNSPERFNSLRANKDPRDQANPGYIDYFYLESHPLLQNQDWSVHFNQIVTIPTSDIALLLQKKVVQLDDRTRMKFKIKLAFTLGRTNNDEMAAGLENPWAEPAVDPPSSAAAPPDAPEQAV